MIKAFIDTNVLLDLFIESRDPKGLSRTIFAAARAHLIEIVLTSQSILDAAYVAQDRAGVKLDVFKNALLGMFNYVNISHIDSFEMRDALLSDTPDIESNVRYAHAESKACDVLITSDRAFIQRKTPGAILMMTPEEFVARMQA